MHVSLSLRKMEGGKASTSHPPPSHRGRHDKTRTTRGRRATARWQTNKHRNTGSNKQRNKTNRRSKRGRRAGRFDWRVSHQSWFACVYAPIASAFCRPMASVTHSAELASRSYTRSLHALDPSLKLTRGSSRILHRPFSSYPGATTGYADWK